MSISKSDSYAAAGVDVTAGYESVNRIKPLVESTNIPGVIGGLGGAVAETLSRRCPTRQAYIGIQDCFGESGKAGDLLKEYGLTAEAIVDACLLA